MKSPKTRRPYGGREHHYRKANSEGPGPSAAGGEHFPLGPLAGRYAAVAAAGGIRIFDVVAARREVLSARLLGATADGPVPSRPFLVPESHPVGVAEAERFEAHEEVLLRLGFELRRVGPERIMLREAPLPLAGTGSADLVAALAAGFATLASGEQGDRISSFVRRVVSELEPPLDWPQVGSLLREVQALSVRPESLSGRIWVELSEDAILALFDAAGRK